MSVLVGCVAVGCFSIGLIFTTGAGVYWLTLFDSFRAAGLTFIAFAELVSVMYVYGHKRFTKDIENMTGIYIHLFRFCNTFNLYHNLNVHFVINFNDICMTGVRPGLYWQVMWRLISPTLMASAWNKNKVLIIEFLSHISSKFLSQISSIFQATGEEKEYPAWALCLAAMLAMSSLIPILIGAAYHLITSCTDRNTKHLYKGGKFFRVDTTASTASTRTIIYDNSEVKINTSIKDFKKKLLILQLFQI